SVPNGQRGRMLGYAILVSVEVAKGKWTYVFESIVHEVGGFDRAEWRTNSNVYLHVKRRYTCSVAGYNYDLLGTYYRQQNSITNVCAHACATMMLNNTLKLRGLTTPEDLNQLLNFDHITHRF